MSEDDGRDVKKAANEGENPFVYFIQQLQLESKFSDHKEGDSVTGGDMTGLFSGITSMVDDSVLTESDKKNLESFVNTFALLTNKLIPVLKDKLDTLGMHDEPEVPLGDKEGDVHGK